jgi:hypothetical protein
VDTRVRTVVTLARTEQHSHLLWKGDGGHYAGLLLRFGRLCTFDALRRRRRGWLVGRLALSIWDAIRNPWAIERALLEPAYTENLLSSFILMVGRRNRPAMMTACRDRDSWRLSRDAERRQLKVELPPDRHRGRQPQGWAGQGPPAPS